MSARPTVRLLCDEMLKGIGRWLRVAGYDTAIAADGIDDDALLAQARAEERLLLTCDRRLAARAPAGLLLSGEGLDEGAAELRERLGIDWLRAPFSRCLVDNAPLAEAPPAALARLPDNARQGDPVTLCPVCGRLYWPGSHVRRMRARLRRWQSG